MEEIPVCPEWIEEQQQEKNIFTKFDNGCRWKLPLQSTQNNWNSLTLAFNIYRGFSLK